MGSGSSFGSLGWGNSSSLGSESSASAEEASSCQSNGSTRMGSSGGVFSKIQSRRASPSSVVFYVKEPPAVISS
jgi:hypothetical protein